MKTKQKILLILGSLMIGFALGNIVGNATTAKPVSKFDIKQDWVMGSPTAVSNAMYFGLPAPGYTVGWATNGTFAPMRSGQALTYNSMMRRSYWQALVATWRDYEVLAPYRK